jgi:YD repeat-containing protein
VVLLAVAVVCLVGAVPGSRGAAVQGSAAAQAPLPAPQQEPQESLTRVITYTYDPLGRLTGAEYSTGEFFAYAYDAVGNRTAYTATTPLSGTLVTTYTYDAARRLTTRAVSDGRTYTYTWSARGQMLAEYTHGYPVRTFAYDGAGRLTAATVFTLTTRFTYAGLGDRVAVEVVGRGVTTYTLDLAAGGQILAEEALTGTVLYLYGHECLGELRDDQWLYYLPDAEGLVRQGVNAGGAVVSGWLFDPDGVVLEGPEGPVSHLVCGGVYDWSTGLIYKGGHYFDPTLGLWLALAPLVVVQSWRGRRTKWRRGTMIWWVIVLLIGMSGILTACGKEATPTPCVDILSFGPHSPLNDYAVFLNPNSCCPGAERIMRPWDEAEKQAVRRAIEDAIVDKFGGSGIGGEYPAAGFGNLGRALDELGISATNPLELARSPNYGYPIAAFHASPSPRITFLGYFFDRDSSDQKAIAVHELAHRWDCAHNWNLSKQMLDWINWGETPSVKAVNPLEDLAYTVEYYFFMERDEARFWTDDFGAGLYGYASDSRYGGKGRDGLRLDPGYEQIPLDKREPSFNPDAPGTVQVYDRYDFLECTFTGKNCKP